ncbi:hypothetical protein AB0L50_08365 [Streptomyces flaveolus]
MDDDEEYVDARLAGDLGQVVCNRRIELGLRPGHVTVCVDVSDGCRRGSY